MMNVQIGFIAAGSVDDFDHARQIELRAAIARVAGLPAVQVVSLDVTPASVRVAASVVVSAPAAERVAQKVREALSTTEKATEVLGVPVESPAFVEVTDIEAGGTLDGLYNTIMSDSVYLFGTYVPIKWLILAAVGAATLLLCALAVFCYCCCCRRHTIVPASMQKTLSRPGILERKRSSYIDVEGSANTSQRRRTYTGHTTTPWSGASSDAGPPTPESSEARRDSAIELTIPAASRPPAPGAGRPRTQNEQPQPPPPPPEGTPPPPPPRLPAGWEETFTPEGELYYFNHDTNETSWEVPASSSGAAGSSSGAASSSGHATTGAAHHDREQVCLSSVTEDIAVTGATPEQIMMGAHYLQHVREYAKGELKISRPSATEAAMRGIAFQHDPRKGAPLTDKHGNFV